MSQITIVDQTATYELRVIEASESGTSLELELKSITATMEQGPEKSSWNSEAPADDKDAANPILRSYRPIVGAVAKIKLGADGAVAGVEQDARLNLNTSVPLAAQVGQLVGADGLRLRWSMILCPKSGRDAAVAGQTWTSTDELMFRQVGRFTYLTTSTLKGAKGGEANIDITGEVKLGPTPDGKPPTGKMKDNRLAGSTLWDTTVGLAKSNKWEQKTILDINAGGFEVVKTSEFTVTTTRE